MHQCELKTHRAARARNMGSTSYRIHRLHFFSFLGRRTIAPVALVRRVTPRALASTISTTSPACTKAPVMRLLAAYREFQGLGFARPIEQVANKNRRPASLCVRQPRALD